MSYLKFDPSYNEWKEKYNNELVYTRKQMDEALEAHTKRMIVNRVIRVDAGKEKQKYSEALQILSIHQTEEGMVVIVK
jgi:hypothetical protein